MLLLDSCLQIWMTYTIAECTVNKLLHFYQIIHCNTQKKAPIKFHIIFSLRSYTLNLQTDVLPFFFCNKTN